MKSLQQKLDQIKMNKGKSDEEFCRSFRAKISPGENQAAEEELKKYIDKTMFEQMEILGQVITCFCLTIYCNFLLSDASQNY